MSRRGVVEVKEEVEKKRRTVLSSRCKGVGIDSIVGRTRIMEGRGRQEFD